MTLKRPYRVGLVGIGFGQRVHVPAFRMDSRFEVRALSASSLERAQTVSRQLAIPQAYGDWRKLVADPGIDIVSIATPPNIQAEILEAAIQAHKHVFLEKPLGGGARRATDLARRAQLAGLASIIDFEFEVVDVWARAKEALRVGRLGPLQHVVVSWNVETRAHREKLTSSWKLKRDEGGGTLNSFGSHSFYYLEWLLGPIAELCARLYPDVHLNPERADEVNHLWLSMRSGIPISLVLSSNSHNRNSHRMEIYGAKGFLVLENTLPDYISGFTLTIHADPMCAPETLLSEFANASVGDGRVLATARLVKRLADIIESGRVQPPGLIEGARVECLIDWTRLSDQQSRWVETEGIA
jgi:predicted dehydrogenase